MSLSHVTWPLHQWRDVTPASRFIPSCHVTLIWARHPTHATAHDMQLDTCGNWVCLRLRRRLPLMKFSSKVPRYCPNFVYVAMNLPTSCMYVWMRCVCTYFDRFLCAYMSILCAVHHVVFMHECFCVCLYVHLYELDRKHPGTGIDAPFSYNTSKILICERPTSEVDAHTHRGCLIYGRYSFYTKLILQNPRLSHMCVTIFVAVSEPLWSTIPKHMHTSSLRHMPRPHTDTWLTPTHTTTHTPTNELHHNHNHAHAHIISSPQHPTPWPSLHTAALCERTVHELDRWSHELDSAQKIMFEIYPRFALFMQIILLANLL